MQRFFIKGIACFVIVLFSFSQIAYSGPEGFSQSVAGPDTTLILKAHGIEIPPELGAIEEIYLPPEASADTPFLIYIQDAHSNYEAQKKIRDILSRLFSRYGFSQAFLEGAQTRLDPRLFRFSEDEGKNLEVADRLMREGEFSGAEYFLLENFGKEKKESFKAYGVEEASGYRENLSAFREVYSRRAAGEAFLSEMNSREERLETLLWSAELRNFAKAWKKSQREENGVLAYLKVLRKAAQKYLNVDLAGAPAQLEYPQLVRVLKMRENESLLRAEEARKETGALLMRLREEAFDPSILEGFERGMNFSSAHPDRTGQDLRSVFEAIYREAPEGFSFREYPNLALWGCRLIFREEIKSKEFMGEIEALSRKLFDVLSGSGEAEALVRIMKDLALLGKVFSLELSREEYESFSRRKEDCAPEKIAEALRAMTERAGRPLASGETTDPGECSLLFSKAISFYEGACRREEAMTQNILELLKQTGKKDAVLLTGGFHTPGMTEKIKAMQMAFMVISPAFSGDSGRANYLASLLGRNAVSGEHLKSALYLIPPDSQSALGAFVEERQGLIREALSAAALGAQPVAASLGAKDDDKALRREKTAELELRYENIVPVVTPLTEDRAIDREGIRKLIDHLISLGVESILVMGATGEFMQFKGEENRKRLEAIRIFAQEAKGRVRIFANATGDTAEETIANLKEVHDYEGIAGAVISPLYYLEDNSQILPHLDRLEEDLAGIENPLPLFLYNNPGITRGLNIDPAAVQQLAERKYKKVRLAGLKDSSGDLDLLIEYAKHLPTFQGDEKQIYSAMAYIQGSVSSAGNVRKLPQLFYQHKRESSAQREIQLELNRIVPDLTADRRKIVAGIKYYLSCIGVIGATVAAGTAELEEKEKENVRSLVDSDRSGEKAFEMIEDRLPEGREDLKTEISDAEALVRNFPKEGTGWGVEIDALLSALYGGSIDIYSHELQRTKVRVWARYRYDIPAGLLAISKGTRGKLTKDQKRQVKELISEAQRRLEELGIGREHFETLKLDPEFQNPFLHTFLGIPRETRMSGKYKLEGARKSRLERAIEAGGFSPEEEAYLRNFRDIHDPRIQVGIPGTARVAEPLSLRVKHNNALGPHKGGDRFIRSWALNEDPVFTERFNALVAQGFKLAELRYFLRKWVKEETMALGFGMSTKNAVVRLPYGGAKGSILFADVVERDGRFYIEDYDSSNRFRAVVLRKRVQALFEAGEIGPWTDIPAPDVGSTAKDMDIMTDELVRLTVERAKQAGTYRSLPQEFKLAYSEAMARTREDQRVEETVHLSVLCRYLAGLREDGKKVPKAMQDLASVIGTYTSKTLAHGGSKFREDSTGYGVIHVTEKLLEEDREFLSSLRPDRKEGDPVLAGLTGKFMGYGAVGKHAVREAVVRGVKVQMIAEIGGIIFKEAGFTLEDLKALDNMKKQPENFTLLNNGDPEYAIEGAGLLTAPDASEEERKAAIREFLKYETDTCFLCAMENAITKENVGDLRAKVVAEGANGAITSEAYDELLARGVTVIPDSVANPGGVSVSYEEWQQNLANRYLTADQVKALLEKRLTEAVSAVSEVRRKYRTDWRTAADILMSESILAAKQIGDIQRMVQNFPKEGPAWEVEIDALLSALYGGSVYIYSHELTRARRRVWTRYRYDIPTGLLGLLRGDQGKLTDDQEMTAEALVRQVERRLGELGIRKEHYETLKINPEYQNPFLHTFLGVPRETRQSGKYSVQDARLSRLERAIKVGGFSRQDEDYLRNFRDIHNPRIQIGLAEKHRVAEPVSLRVRHNNALGPHKGGDRFIKASTLLRDPIFMGRFNALVSQGCRIAELRYFLRKWVKEETMALAFGMSTKNAVVKLPYGGGKGSLLFADVVERDGKFYVEDYDSSDYFRKILLRRRVRSLFEAGLIGPRIDIPAPDVGSNAKDMDIMTDELLRLQIEKAKRTGVYGHFAPAFQKKLNERLAEVTAEDEVESPVYLEVLSEYLAGLRDAGKKVPASMKELAESIATYTSKNIGLGGSQFRTESTGYGVIHVAEKILEREREFLDKIRPVERLEGESLLKGLTTKIMGYGGVGIYAAYEAERRGARVEMLSEGPGGIVFKEGGFTRKDLKVLEHLKSRYGNFMLLNDGDQDHAIEGATLLAGSGATEEERKEAQRQFLAYRTNLYIPSAMENSVTMEELKDLEADIIAEAANGAVTSEAYDELLARGVLVIPDSLANPGGVSVSYEEWVQNLENRYLLKDEVRELLEKRLTEGVAEVAAVRERFRTDWRTASDIFTAQNILAVKNHRNGEIEASPKEETKPVIRGAAPRKSRPVVSRKREGEAREAKGASLGQAPITPEAVAVAKEVTQGVFRNVPDADVRARWAEVLGFDTKPGIVESGVLESLPESLRAVLAASEDFGIAVSSAATFENIARMEPVIRANRNKLILIYYAGPENDAAVRERNLFYREKFEGRIMLVKAEPKEKYSDFLEAFLQGGRLASDLRARAKTFFTRAGGGGVLGQNEFLKFLTVVAPENIFSALASPFVRPFYSRDLALDPEAVEFAELVYAVIGSGRMKPELLKKQVGDNLEMRLSPNGADILSLALNSHALSQYLELLSAMKTAQSAMARAA